MYVSVCIFNHLCVSVNEMTLAFIIPMKEKKKKRRNRIATSARQIVRIKSAFLIAFTEFNYSI